MDRKYKNSSERDFAEWAEGLGWSATKRGWPDFFVETPEGEVCAVEVKKSGNYGLKRSQRRVCEALERHGIASYRWTPEDGLKPISTVVDRGRAARRGEPAAQDPEPAS